MNWGKRWIIILRSIIISYGITLLLFGIYAFILVKTNVPESTIPVCTLILTLISIFMGSSLAVIKIKEKGLVNGGLVGGIYILILYLLSSVFSTGFSLHFYAIETIIFCCIVGMIGGIIGVNMIKHEKG